MGLVRVLRILLILEAASGLTSIAADFSLQSSLPDPLRDFIAEQGSQPFDVAQFGLGVVILTGIVAGWIGLWQLKPWARALYSIVSGIALISLPLAGPIVSHATAQMFAELCVTAGGMTLGLIWFSPLADRFKPPVQALYMVIENYKNNDPVPVYRRFREHGRMAPEGVSYVSSWVDRDLGRCYQVMEAPDRALLDQWMANWTDLIDFEVHSVMTSQEASEKTDPLL